MTLKDNRKEQGIVYFVGAGPGDPKLITLRASELLKEADVVIHAGSLVNKKILSLCSSDAILHDSRNMELTQIVGLMKDAAASGKLVVRLHTGDPTFYSALKEQADPLIAAGIPFEVVPGVSSAFASAAALKSELTTPGITQTIILTRIEGRTPVPDAEKLSSLASHGATLCIFLSAAMIDRVVEELAKGGLSSDTPAAVVYRASWEDEVALRGTLSDISEKVKEAGITKHAMIIVSRTLDPKGLDEASKLYDKDFEHGCRKS